MIMITVSVMKSQRSRATIPSISLTRIGERGRISKMIRRLWRGEGARGIMAILVVTTIAIRIMTTSKTTTKVKATISQSATATLAQFQPFIDSWQQASSSATSSCPFKEPGAAS
jgi:hypothetical protein